MRAFFQARAMSASFVLQSGLIHGLNIWQSVIIPFSIAANLTIHSQPSWSIQSSSSDGNIIAGKFGPEKLTAASLAKCPLGCCRRLIPAQIVWSLNLKAVFWNLRCRHIMPRCFSALGTVARHNRSHWTRNLIGHRTTQTATSH